VTGYFENPSQVWVNVEMACQGLLIVSDNWYPGWRAEVDGRPTEIWRVNTVIRGVVVNAGRHTVAMRYRPLSVYFGFAFTLLGLAAAIVLHRRPETDGRGHAGRTLFRKKTDQILPHAFRRGKSLASLAERPY
jgi:hypothetical protein